MVLINIKIEKDGWKISWQHNGAAQKEINEHNDAVNADHCGSLMWLPDARQAGDKEQWRD